MCIFHITVTVVEEFFGLFFRIGEGVFISAANTKVFLFAVARGVGTTVDFDYCSWQ